MSETTMLFFKKVSEDNCDEVEELLSSNSDLQVNEAADTAGNTALHLAAEKGSVAMVNLLIKHGAKLDVANTSSGRITRCSINVRIGLREGALLIFCNVRKDPSQNHILSTSCLRTVTGWSIRSDTAFC